MAVVNSGVAGSDWLQWYAQQAVGAADARIAGFYAAGCPHPHTPLAQVPFVALDFETTGLNASQDEIVSIGLVPFSLQRIRVREARRWLIRPQGGLDQQSVVYHGITHSDLSDAPGFESVIAELLTALSTTVVVVHCRYIERDFLDTHIRRYLNERIRFPLIDTMALEAELHRKPASVLLRKLIGVKPQSIRLADSRQRYQLPHYGSHDALMDAIATAELFQAQVAHHYSGETRIEALWL